MTCPAGSYLHGDKCRKCKPGTYSMGGGIRFDAFYELDDRLFQEWLGMVGCGWVWLGMVGCGWVWLRVVGYGWYRWVWLGVVGCGCVWLGMVWYGMVWYGMVWYGMVWYGMVWYGMVWYGMVWYGMAGWPGSAMTHADNDDKCKPGTYNTGAGIRFDAFYELDDRLFQRGLFFYVDDQLVLNMEEVSGKRAAIWHSTATFTVHQLPTL
ncbi:unnamed protein product [Closterium sp. Yama58-4]|nr:unnamed protein product [Closterium sp. Yama58-4]